MSYDRRVVLTKDGPSLSRLVFGAWRLLDGAARPDADAGRPADRHARSISG